MQNPPDYQCLVVFLTTPDCWRMKSGRDMIEEI